MKNKHPEFYQQYTETLNLNEGVMPKMREFDSGSSNNQENNTPR